MNTQKALLILAATVAAGSNVYADKVSLEQTPPAVQQAIRAKTGGAPVEDIDRETRNGQVTYEASFKRNGTQQEILVSEQGSILRDAVGPSGGLANSNITLANRNAIALTAAPAAVQQAIQAHARGASIESVDRGIWNGQNIYEAAYTQNGQRMVYQVTESGKPVVSPVPLTGSGAQQVVANAVQQQQLSLKSPLPNSVNMQLRDAPQVVQNAVHKARDGARIEHFERGEANGRAVYQVGFRKNGQPMLAQFLDNGTLLRQGAGGWTSAQSTTTTTNPGVISTPTDVRYAGLSASNVPLSGGSKIGLSAAPEAVQRTVSQIAGGAQVEDFERGQWNGRTVYEAAFKRNGQHTELQVLEDGSILTSGLTAGASPSAQQGVVTGNAPRYAGLSDGNVPLSGGSKLAFDSAPQPVKDAVNAIASGAQIEDMERGTWNGRTVYEAAFKKNGQHMELQVLEDGSYVTRGPVSAAGAPAVGTSATNQQ